MVFKCIPKFVEKIWGDENLAKRYSVNGKIGEVWLCSDFPSNKTDIIDENGKKISWDMINDMWQTTRFPFLIKHIKATQWLSVQVHPDDRAARKVGEPWGKPEMWFFLNGGKIVNGFKRGAIAEVKKGNRDWKSLLNFVEVKAGQAVYIQPGTVHAMGPNVEVYEFQLTSDMTYRLYDWDRGRKLHFEEAMSVATENIAEPFEFREFSCPHFSVKLIQADGKIKVKKSVYLVEKGLFKTQKCEVPTSFISCEQGEIAAKGRIFEMGAKR